MADPVWWLAGRFVRLPRPFGGFPSRRGYYSRLRYIAARAHEIWVPSELTQVTLKARFGLSSRRVPYCYDSNRFRPRNVLVTIRRRCSRSRGCKVTRISRRRFSRRLGWVKACRYG